MGPAAVVTSTQEDRMSPVLSSETPSRGAVGCFSNIPDLKKDLLYNLLGMISQWYNKNVKDS